MTLKQALALRIEPESEGATDVIAMANRSIRMQALFTAFHRDDPNSDHYGCFTGLHDLAQQQMPDDAF